MRQPMPSPSVCFAMALTLAVGLRAQIGGTGADGALSVTAGTVTLDTSLRPGGFDFTTITVAAGAELRLRGTFPARLRAQGAVTIDGLVNADGFTSSSSAPGEGGPGGFAGGAGGRGVAGIGGGPGGGCAGAASGTTLVFQPGPASHATPAQAGTWCGQPFGSPPPTYGTAWPFDLRGGSGAGGTAVPSSVSTPGPGGAGGGGTIVLAADGPIVVRGSIRAKSPPGANVPAAAGSILVQSTVSLRIDGEIDAEASGLPVLRYGGAGFIRLDTHGEPAAGSGNVVPAPMRVVLPRFRDVAAPVVGTVWQVQLDAWPQDVLGVWISGRSAALPIPPLGLLQLDPAAGLALLGAAATTPSATGLEATASLPVSVPNAVGLRGVTLHAQALNIVTRAPSPRLSELLTRTIQ